MTMLGPVLETLIGGLLTGVLYSLVALGFVNSDSFGGLRALLVPSDRRKSAAGARRGPELPRRRPLQFVHPGRIRAVSVCTDEEGGGRAPAALTL